MTLDEAIKHCQEVAKQDCTECGKEHERLAMWLTELMSYRATDNEPKVNRAEILRLCNEIEDVFGELCGKYEFSLYYYSEIMKRIKAIGKELTGDEGTDD